MQWKRHSIWLALANSSKKKKSVGRQNKISWTVGGLLFVIILDWQQDTAETDQSGINNHRESK